MWFLNLLELWIFLEADKNHDTSPVLTFCFLYYIYPHWLSRWNLADKTGQLWSDTLRAYLHGIVSINSDGKHWSQCIPWVHKNPIHS